jgi:hypothetical protein
VKINDATVYLTDNGAAYCGAHLGATAKATGHDISGQPILQVTPAIAAECEYTYGYVPQCELCGRKAVTG